MGTGGKRTSGVLVAVVATAIAFALMFIVSMHFQSGQISRIDDGYLLLSFKYTSGFDTHRTNYIVGYDSVEKYFNDEWGEDTVRGRNRSPEVSCERYKARGDEISHGYDTGSALGISESARDSVIDDLLRVGKDGTYESYDISIYRIGDTDFMLGCIWGEEESGLLDQTASGIYLIDGSFVGAVDNDIGNIDEWSTWLPVGHAGRSPDYRF